MLERDGIQNRVYGGIVMSRLLLLEDDVSLIDGLRYSLEKDGFEL